jgi:dipeptidyl aminopeptidase/acylaminoacyl peptidase
MSVLVLQRADGSIVRTLSRSVAVTGGLRWSPDGHSVSFFESPPGRPFASWLAAAPAGGGATRPLTRDYGGTVLAAEWAPDSTRLLAKVIEGTQGGVASVDASTGAMTRLADVAAGQWGAGLSTNGHATAYLAETPGSPQDVWLLADGSKPRRLTALNQQTSSWRLGAVREVSWKNSRDGLTRRGVIVTPPDFRPGQPRPTVVQTHPGDTAYWTGWHATWWDWAQLLASNGFVVFLPNTRGVTGEGWALHESTVEWGGMAFQDLMDGVDMLVAERIADPERLGIGGWSNGGFMAEYAVTHTTRFKAGVALAGHSNFFSLYGTSPIQPALRHAFGAGAHEDRTAYDRHSPITNVRQCRTPMLLLHGANDSPVPVSQSYEFFAGLRDGGVEAELVVFPRERHSLREYAHQLDLQRRVLAWFSRHLGVATKDAPSRH